MPDNRESRSPFPLDENQRDVTRFSSERFFILARIAILASVLTIACKTANVGPPPESPETSAITLNWRLPPALEADRAEYLREVSQALEDVARFFRSSGFEVAPRELIDSVVLFEKTSDAREYFAKTFGTPPEALPDTFAGTVDGRTLYLVSREAYEGIWKQLYPEWPWTESTYHGLIVHELAHRAHESIAISRLGSADAMGPPWFFEGLAVVCARQFEETRSLLTREEIQSLVGETAPPAVSYPLYGCLVRSLAGQFGMKVLITRAAEPGFPSVLWTAHS